MLIKSRPWRRWWRWFAGCGLGGPGADMKINALQEQTGALRRNMKNQVPTVEDITEGLKKTAVRDDDDGKGSKRGRWGKSSDDEKPAFRGSGAPPLKLASKAPFEGGFSGIPPTPNPVPKAAPKGGKKGGQKGGPKPVGLQTTSQKLEDRWAKERDEEKHEHFTSGIFDSPAAKVQEARASGGSVVGALGGGNGGGRGGKRGTWIICTSGA